MSRTVLLLGTHRSGTSAVAGVLHRLGCNMGTRLLGKSSSNPHGHYEDLDFLYLNDRVIGDWKHPNPLPSDEDLDRYRQLCEQKSAIFPLWGVKDPRLCFTARYLLPHLEDVVFVLTHRANTDVVASLAARERCEWLEAQAITDIYRIARAQTLDDFPEIPFIDIRYEDLCAHPYETAARLASFIAPIASAAAFVGVDNEGCEA